MNTDTNSTETITRIAGQVAQAIAENEYDAADLAELHSDAGMTIEGAAYWHNEDRDTVIAFTDPTGEHDTTVEIRVERTIAP